MWLIARQSKYRSRPSPDKSTAERVPRKNSGGGLRALLDVIAQLGDRAEPKCALRQLRLNGAVGIQGVGHSVDDTRFEHRHRLWHGNRRGRLGHANERLAVLLRFYHGWDDRWSGSRLCSSHRPRSLWPE